jgi:hypothetical protein
MAEYTEAEARAWIDEAYGLSNGPLDQPGLKGRKKVLAAWDKLVAERDALRRVHARMSQWACMDCEQVLTDFDEPGCHRCQRERRAFAAVDALTKGARNG